MRISKMISVANQCVYLLFAVLLVGFYLENRDLIILVLLIIYNIYLFIKSKQLFCIALVLMGIYIFSYQINMTKLNRKENSETMTCQIITIPEYKETSIQFYCKNKKMKLLVHVYDTAIVLKIGEKIRFHNTLERVKNNTIPNQFNYAKYLKSQGIAYQNKVDTVSKIEENQTVYYALINHLNDYYASSRISDYLLSFIIGNKKAFDDEFSDQTQMLNISHLFVVSGFHVGFLYICIKFFLKYLKCTKEKSEIVVQCILILFLVCNQFSISVLRAVLLIFFMQIKNYYRIQVHNINLLSLIALFNLFFNPFILNHTGFLLSYGITFILFLSHELLSKKRNHKFSILVSLFKVNIIAQLFSLPIIANFNFSYNFISILFTPFLSLYYTFIIFPFTIIGLVLKSLDEVIYPFFSCYEQLLMFLSKLTILNLNVGFFDVYRVIIYYLILYLIMINLENRKFSKILTSILLVVTLYYYPLSITGEVTYLDVGQGDSIFINSPFDHCSALIDTGGNLNYHPGENVSNYLKSKQIRKIDVLFITHTDIDHAGDYRFILKEFKIRTIVFNAYDNSPLQEEIALYAKDKSINILKLKAYNRVECGKLSFKIINPVTKNNTINDNSLVLFLIFNGENYLFMGDASSELIKLNVSTIDFLKVSHHGSKFDTSDDFLRLFDVKNAVISVGKNTYHHPSDEVLNLLNKKDIQYFRTDRDGTISVKYYLRFKRMIVFYSPYNKYIK